ncbi:MAG: glycosyltransferase family 2 protein [Rhodoferax sp.]|nr:glycosyltransferase family 2 protein [Rhodoferax sp.]
MAADTLISCLCVTRNRVAMLRRAVACFLSQTYEARELVILYESDDLATRHFVQTLSDPRILSLEVGASPRLTLGSLRNLALRACRGAYIAQWDDDDWYAPIRLEAQMFAMASTGRSGCVLTNWTLYDAVTRTAMLSGSRCWEGSLVARREAVPPYAEISKQEDTPVIERMLHANQLAGLNRPDLYVYVYHGENTWERAHWDTVIAPFAQPLSPEETRQVELLLQVPR